MNYTKNLIVLLLILIFIQPVLAEDYSLVKQMQLDLDLSANVTLIPTKSSYSVDEVTADLYFFPRNTDRQKVVNMETSPDSEEKDDSLIFSWDSPNNLDLNLNLKAKIGTENKIAKIKSKIKFPLQNIPLDFIQYTEPSPFIDSDNPKIISTASKIAAGSDDLYQVVFNLYDFVKTFTKYDLSSAETIEKASWVLENKRGTCDEFANLFIALARSLGIPAKYVSGISYSNLKEIEGFGWHAWARVYFPGYGWIDVDPTYGQFNNMDVSHVLLREGLSGNVSSTKYQWRGRNVDLTASSLGMKADVTEQKSIIQSLLNLNLGIIEDKVGFGSFNLIKATINNPNPYYAAATLNLAVPSEITVLNKEKRIFLAPESEKQIYWIINLTENLKEDYIYTFPLQLFSERNASSKTLFQSSKRGNIFSYEEINNLFKQLQEEEQKIYSKKIYLNCTSNKKKQYLYENPILDCKIKNKGNIFLKNIKLCLENNCKLFDLGITQERNFDFNITEQLKQVKITATNKDISKTIFPDLEILDLPEIEILDLKYPSTVKFNEKYDVSFRLEKKSNSLPKNIEIQINNKKVKFSQLNKTQDIIFNLNANDLRPNNNKINLIVKYSDYNNKEYSFNESFDISLVNLNIFQKIYLWFRQLI